MKGKNNLKCEMGLNFYYRLNKGLQAVGMPCKLEGQRSCNSWGSQGGLSGKVEDAECPLKMNTQSRISSETVLESLGLFCRHEELNEG